jgi:hypothetical protein
MEFTVEILPNSLITIICRASKLRGTYNADYTYRHGDLRLSVKEVEGLVGYHYPDKYCW